MWEKNIEKHVSAHGIRATEEMRCSVRVYRHRYCDVMTPEIATGRMEHLDLFIFPFT